MKKITFLLVLFAATGFSQTITRTYPLPSNSQNYSFGSSAPIVETPDGGYLLNYSYSYPNWDAAPGYSTTIVKTDADFVPQWSKRAGIGNGRKTIALNDGSSLIYFDSGALLKLDANGQTVFFVSYFTTHPDRLYISDVEMIGNTIKAVGTKATYNGFGFVTASLQVMIDFDTNGTVLQTYVLNDNGTSPWPQPTNICKDNSGNYYVTGYSSADGHYVCKFNSTNAVVWSRRFGNDTIAISDIMSLSNGDLLLVGSTGSPLLYRISSATGAPIAAKVGSAYSGGITSVSQLSNGDLAATGWLKESQNAFARTFSMKTDSNGVFSWLKLYNYGFGISTPFIKTPNNWYYTAFHNNYANNNNPILFNTDNTGVTSCPHTNINLNLIATTLNSTAINFTITPNPSLLGTPLTGNFYLHPTETQTYQDACLSLAANEIEDAGNLAVYPNPSRGEVHVVSETEIKSIEVWNTLSQKVNVYHPTGLETALSIENNGLYLIKVETETGIKTTKVVISN